MVDMAIAANFVRELTEDQFAQPQRVRRRNATANRAGTGSGRAARESDRREPTRVGRTLARLAHVRG
jgi:hypothetical protein